MKLLFHFLLLALCCAVISTAYVCNDDKYCDQETESCLWCSDCKCSFDGVKVSAWKNRKREVDNTTDPQQLAGFQLFSSNELAIPSNFVNATYPFFMRMEGYLQVNKTQHYFIQIVSQTVGVALFVDGQEVTSFPPQPESKSTTKLVLQNDYIHKISLEVQSFSNDTKLMSVSWKMKEEDTFVNLTPYFSYRVCGDQILDDKENCTTDDVRKVFRNKTDQCGDGLCLERFPESCFVDCYTEITKTCSPIAVPPGHISAGLPVRDDTIGSLVRNQMLWHLPGIEHMSYGFHIVTGEQSLNPVFEFSYCDGETLSTVQDTYRGNVYTVPQGLFAQPSPKCSFSVDSKFFSSSVKMANSYQQDSSVEASLSGGGSFWGVSASASVAYSQEKSVSAAREQEKKASGTVIVTEVSCETSKVQLGPSYSFHPRFLEDLAGVKNVGQMKSVIKKYGTHIYSSAVLGGRLRQVTTITKDTHSSKSKEELSESASLSFSASVSSPVFSASGSFSGSVDSSSSTEKQGEYQDNSFRSTVLTYGGPPGSFGPTTSDAPSNFGDWASNIDLLPVPIHYTLRPIYNIIPDSWKIKLDTGVLTSVRQTWNDAESMFRSEINPFYEDPLPYKYTFVYLWDGSLTSVSLPSNAEFYLVMGYNTNTGKAQDTIRIVDQRPGQRAFLDYTKLPNPFRMTFYMDHALDGLNYLGMSTNLPLVNMSGVWAGAERKPEIQVLDWQTGGVSQANNYAISNSSYYYRFVNIKSYEIMMNTTNTKNPVISSATYQITIFGSTGKQVTLFFSPGMPTSSTIYTTRMYWTNQPLVGTIKSMEIRITPPSALSFPENATIITFSDLTVITSDGNQAFGTNPGKQYQLDTFYNSASPLKLKLLKLNEFWAYDT